MSAMSDGPDLRVSDQERDRAAAEIREHYAAGRLSEDELNERVGSVYGARTAGELATLRADLPALPASPAETRAELAQRRSKLQRALLQQTGGGLVPFAICTAIWVSAGAHGAFWPVWFALAALLPLLRGAWLLYGPDPELDRVEQHLARQHHGDRHARHRDRHDRRHLR
jgi:hypothetical protein